MANKISTTELIEKVYLFCEALSGDLFPYQRKFAMRIIRSIIENEGAEISGLFSRQSGKSQTVACVAGGCSVILPILANMPMFLNDKRLEPFIGGYKVGIFAPALHQAQIVFNRIRDFFGSERAISVLTDAEVNVGFDTNNGQNIVLRMLNIGVTSVITCMSASDQSNIEGKSYMLIVVDEAQDVGDVKYRKSIRPMAAFYNGTSVVIGTPTIQRGFFYDTIERNSKDYENGIARKNHYQNDWKEVVKYNPNYEKYVRGEMRKIGEDSDEFQMAYCVAPETKILTADLRWIKAESIKIGDVLAGFDEEPPKRYAQRRFQKSVVEDIGRITRPCYHLTFDDGTKVTCSSEHQWLVFTAGSRTEWKKTEDLVFTDRVYRPITPWDEPENNYKLGYLSAAYDGEGNLSQVNGVIGQVCFTQKPNIMLEKVQQYLTDFGFNYVVRHDHVKDISRVLLTGGRDSFFRFLGMVRPERLLNKFDIDNTGTLRFCGHSETGFSHPNLISKEFVGNKEVIPIRTSTRTFIADGLASHNCLKWIFERGMFVDPDRFESLADSDREMEDENTNDISVVGIDLGKAKDSTVVTVLGVDWDNPIVLDKSPDPEVPDFIVYNTWVRGWMEIQGDDWNSQYEQLMDYLANWRVGACVMDATGVGNPIYDRVAVNVSFPVIPYVFSTQSKSALMKFFDSHIKAGRFRYPAGEQVRETKLFQHFYEQFITALKSYNGQHLVVSAPNSRNAHDDFVFSAALAVWGIKQETSVPESSKVNPFLEKANHNNVFFSSRNRFTARRR